MSTRAAVTELLHAGHSDKAIAAQVHIHRRTVSALRAELGLPVHKPGPCPADPVVLFWQRTQPTDDGHRLWTAPGRQLRGGDNKISVYRIAFRIGNGRDPVGPVTGGCDQAGCVHPDHVEDQPMRRQYKAIFGAVAA